MLCFVLRFRYDLPWCTESMLGLAGYVSVVFCIVSMCRLAFITLLRCVKTEVLLDV